MTRGIPYSGPGAPTLRAGWGAGWGAHRVPAAVTAIETTPIRRRGIELRERHGIWHVTRDGAFAGDFLARETAEAAVTAARRALQHRDGPGPARRDDWRIPPGPPTAPARAGKG